MTPLLVGGRTCLCETAFRIPWHLREEHARASLVIRPEMDSVMYPDGGRAAKPGV
jgi:hypothetical protein